MIDEIKKYSQQLRRLVDGYYHQQLTMEDYRVQRKLILDQLEMEFARNADGGDARRTSPLDSPTSPS